jgi:predicted transcriptional regulator of viral defense system
MPGTLILTEINLVRWTKQGLYYTPETRLLHISPEYGGKSDYIWYFANRIYRPSYISLHTALSFYGMIPEAVIQISSVTSLKTASFSNAFGEYSYRSVKEELMFGYEHRPVTGSFILLFALPEKAILDLLYLYPFYNSDQEMEEFTAG